MSGDTQRENTGNGYKPPRYCPDCKSRDSWVRMPARDWLTELGKVFEYAYGCKVCGARTLVNGNNLVPKGY